MSDQSPENPPEWLYIRPGKDRPWEPGNPFTAYPLGPIQPADESPIVKFTIPHPDQDESEASSDA